MGWGHVNGETGVRAAEHLLGVTPAGDKPAEAVAYQGAVYDYRVAAWNAVI